MERESPPPRAVSDEASAIDREALAAACALLGARLGVALAMPQDVPADQPLLALIGGIARASRLRIRAVALRGAWWEGDHGPLLAVQTSGSRPVVLLPDQAGRYWLHDPRAGERRSLTPALALTLDPFAYSVIRPLPDGPLTLARFLRFGLGDSGVDLRRLALLSALIGLLSLVPPQAARLIVDQFIPVRDGGQLLLLALLLLAATLTTAVFELVRGLTLLRIETRLGVGVQGALWDRLLRLPVGFFRGYAAGDLAQRTLSFDAIRQLLTTNTITSLLAGVFAGANLILLCLYDWELARLALALAALAALIIALIAWQALAAERQLVAVEARLSGEVHQLVSGIAKLRVAGAERRAFERWAAQFAGQQGLVRRARHLDNLRAVFIGALPTVALLALFAALMLRQGPAPSPGTIVAFLAAFAALLAGLGAISEGLITVVQTIPLFEQARPLLAAAPEARAGQRDPGTLRGAVALREVSYRYDGAGRFALAGISLEAQPGEFVAIVGPSGSGKSTLLRLLLGFAQPQAGQVLYDGQDLATLAVEGVRRQLGVVLQHDQLIPGDIFTNIAGSGLATLGDAWEAARVAGLAEEIRQLPMGMYTAIGAGASTFSGGQRQRLLIARAVVRQPAILCFDEATSALDNLKQAEVMRQLAQLRATRIVIAHRLSTIQQADRIYVLVEGRVAQAGRYDELAAEPGPFQDLIRRQQLA